MCALSAAPTPISIFGVGRCAGLVSLWRSKPAHLIDGVHELRPEWFAGVDTVLITAGASAPEVVVQDCIEYLQREYGAVVDEITTREEHVSFPLPRELRSMRQAAIA